MTELPSHKLPRAIKAGLTIGKIKGAAGYDSSK